MSNPTTPFGWQMPTPTDLVTNLPADFEVFGQAVATSMGDLLGGTTGQVLAKASNADMDFVWSADAAGMTNPMTTTGDTIFGSPGSTPSRLGIGSTGQVLTVAGGVPTWASPAGGGKIKQVIYSSYNTSVTVSGNSFADSGLTGTITPSATSSRILILTYQYILCNRGARDVGLVVKLVRNSTDIFEPSPSSTIELGYIDASSGGNVTIKMNMGVQYIDSPSTTSSITYKTQMCGTYASSTTIAQQSSIVSNMILMEIGA